MHGFNEDYYQLFDFDLKFEKGRLRIEDFGSRIVYEEKYINEMNENVLKISPIDIGTSDKSPMQQAVEKIGNYLKTGTPLSGLLIEDISHTMNLIWEGQRQWELI